MKQRSTEKCTAVIIQGVGINGPWERRSSWIGGCIRQNRYPFFLTPQMLVQQGI